MQRLVQYFTSNVAPCALGESVGMEIETQFLDTQGRPIRVQTSQMIMRGLVRECGFVLVSTKGSLVTEIASPQGDKVLYELGRHNIELGTVPLPPDKLIPYAREMLELLYRVAARSGARPLFRPVLETDENLLVIPDERDAVWLELDGKNALSLLARCSAVQFTVDVPPHAAITYLNRLGYAINKFLSDYPQEKLWRRYLRESRAGYDSLRYGGPLFFEDLNDYCSGLARHAVVMGSQLVPFDEVSDLDIPLFLRSIWWYFRLKRYGSKLCIEVRPCARRDDDALLHQLNLVMNILS